MCWIHPSCAGSTRYRAYVTRPVTRPMQRTQAHGKLSSIAASHPGYSELSSIAVDQQACQLTGTNGTLPTHKQPAE